MGRTRKRMRMRMLEMIQYRLKISRNQKMRIRNMRLEKSINNSSKTVRKKHLKISSNKLQF